MTAEIERTQPAYELDGAHSESEYKMPAVIRKITPEDSVAWLGMGRLRAQSYVEEHQYLTKSVLNEFGAEYDKYDPFSSHFVVEADDSTVVGYSRIVYKDRGNKLPAEDLFGIELDERDFEISRLIVDKAVNGDSPLTSVHLIRAMAFEGREHGGRAYAVVEPFLYKYLKHVIGIDFRKEADVVTIEAYNSDNMLISVDPWAVTRDVHALDKKGRPSFLGLPERLAPFFEMNSAAQGLGAIALDITMNEPIREQYDRNLGWIHEQEMKKLFDSRVAIAGVGGDGGDLAVTLAQLGVGKFVLADPERFTVNNVNRQTGASFETIGRFKAEVIAEMIKDINPFAEVDIFTEGVSPDNIDTFMSDANIVVDETEYSTPEIGVMIAQAARKHGLPNLMALNVGFGSYVTSFHPEGYTYEQWLGLKRGIDPAEAKESEVGLERWLTLPKYTNFDALKKVESDPDLPTPTVAPGVKMAAADASTQVLAHLLAEMSPQRASWISFAPEARVQDAVDGVKKIHHSPLHFYSSALGSYVRTRLGKTPPSGY